MTTHLRFDVQHNPQARGAAERERMLASPGFGQVFTDHMVSIDYTEGEGWHDARLQPYGPLVLDPATAVFHYAQELFEGLKAYRQSNGSIVAFRPYANAARFNQSAARMAMPALPEETFVESLELLVQTDREWVPTAEGHSLYLRPFMIATQTALGVNHPSQKYKFLVIASPAASYFTGGLKPVSVWLSTEYTRAAPGGTGFAKCGGNYAAAFVAQRQAVEEGCDQVVWLDAFEHRWVEEMGGMNLFFVFGDRLVTPSLTGTLLPGITRDSILSLAGELGYTVEEGKISIEDWQAGCESGELTEVFACGTAAVVTPVGSVKGTDRSWTVGDGTPGPVTMRIREELVGIQYGARPDTHHWVHKIC
ncbi:branched-chain amino acid aminotransferase [Microbispora triticiradicis]|uniref:Branched-chain-amino-acid aminotransferase n=1 Tax=Microbispora triticiradicis TaxID=2200763 RepID=A0ABX9LPS6_9ACTN|nr:MULTISPECIES: branched-chain amino acid aminotransferase [Microbispora]RGA06021.1 branched-chain amino acid aminotransferase [Microbispora triticiradicis]GLW24499.1 branched-chain-amino-acid aminotransferase [Microbispora amethystogenes]